jgi:hypothetical protein
MAFKRSWLASCSCVGLELKKALSIPDSQSQNSVKDADKSCESAISFITVIAAKIPASSHRYADSLVASPGVITVPDICSFDSLPSRSHAAVPNCRAGLYEPSLIIQTSLACISLVLTPQC